MRIVYIAGPLTHSVAWRQEQNIRRAEEAGKVVAEMGASPIIPHSNTRFFHGLMTAPFWYEATLALLRMADAVFMLPGWRTSSGATREHDEAMEIGTPVFESYDALEKWLGVEYCAGCEMPQEWCECKEPF